MIWRRISNRYRRWARQAQWRRGMRPRSMAARPAAGAPVHVFIRCWNRPSHLWASLDSLYRNTTTPCRFVLIDNASDDPEALRVIEGFARRGMFGAVHRMPRNDPGNQQEVYALHRAALGPFLVLADADVIVDAATPDWLDRMLRVMRARPRLGLLGAAIDPSDFVSMERARALAPEAPDAVLERLVKANSAERRQPPLDSRAEIINPYPPAGRLLLARTEALDRTGALIGARRLCAAVEAEGFEVGITPQVVHRHLSLLNLFDYPDYDFAQLHRYLGGR